MQSADLTHTMKDVLMRIHSLFNLFNMSLYRQASVLSIISMAFGLMSCIDASAPDRDPLMDDEILNYLLPTPLAATMAVGDTLPLQLDAYSLGGIVIPFKDYSKVVFTSSDITKVRIDSSGALIAVAPSNGVVITITATYTHLAVTKQTSIEVVVTPTRADVRSIRIFPRDSAQWAGVGTVVAQAFTATPDAIAGAHVRVLVNKTGVPASAGSVGLVRSIAGMYLAIIPAGLGEHWLYAVSNIYGTSFLDSLRIAGLYSATLPISITSDTISGELQSTMANTHRIVQPCAAITFSNRTNSPVSILFDEPTEANGCAPGDLIGNIENLAPNQSSIRKFRNVGMRRWTVRRLDIGIIVPNLTATFSMQNP